MTNVPGNRAGEQNKIVRQKLSDQVFVRLREKIEDGTYRPGEPMPSERDLMERFGVGRPAVREALQQMHTLGLITIAQGGRARVNQLSTGAVIRNMDSLAQLLLSTSPENLEHLKDARRMFELGMIRIAAERASDQDVSDLETLVQRQRAALDDPDTFIRTDMEFHQRIARISANPIFAGLSEVMLGWLFRYHTDLLRWSGKEKTTLQEHDEIVAAIAAHAPEDAVAVMRDHLDRSSKLYRHPG